MQTLKNFHVKNNPLDSLITIQIILFQALRAQSDQHLWMSNNRLLENVGLGLGGVPQSSQQLNQQQGSSGGNINDWAGALSLNLQPIYSQMAQQ